MPQLQTIKIKDGKEYIEETFTTTIEKSKEDLEHELMRRETEYIQAEQEMEQLLGRKTMLAEEFLVKTLKLQY